MKTFSLIFVRCVRTGVLVPLESTSDRSCTSTRSLAVKVPLVKSPLKGALDAWQHAAEAYGKSGNPFAGVANVDPRSFESLLAQLARYGKPIYITENGMFETDAENQSRYMVAHIAAMQRAMQAGADVRGYYWWTLVDNFEWSEGYSPRFGLFNLDRETQQRSAKPVAAIYAQIIRENGIAPELLTRYAGATRI